MVGGEGSQKGINLSWVAVAGIVAVHFLWFFAMIASFVFVFLWDWYGPIAIALLALMAFASAVFRECPLTRWERKFRVRAHGLLSYEGPCVGYYVHRLLGLRLSPRRVKIINTSVGVLLLLATLVAVAINP